MFETVHTLTNYYDGPREGIADYRGQPHLFQSEWAYGENLDSDTFLLMPLDSETFALALEDWAIWLRWQAAFSQGATTIETHPALPEDRSRHDDLKRQLDARLQIDPARAVRKRGEFRANTNLNRDGSGWANLEVRWVD